MNASGILLRLTLTIAVVALPGLASGQDFSSTNLSNDEQMYLEPPYKYEGNKFIVFYFKSTPEVLKALVPAPLEPKVDGEIMLYISWLNIVDPEPYSYYEAALTIPCSYGETEGDYMPILYLDSTLGVVGGRELYGYRKIDAKITIEEEDGLISARVERDGVLIMKATVKPGESLSSVPPQPDSPTFNIKEIPSAETNDTPALKRLISVTLEDVKINKVAFGEGTLEFGSAPRDPLASIPILEITQSLYAERDFTLGFGKVLFDFLADEAEK